MQNYYKQRELPFSPMNLWRDLRRPRALAEFDNGNTKAVELSLPGLMEPATVKVTMSDSSGRSVIVTGEVFDQTNAHKIGYDATTIKTVPFEQSVPVPVNAENPVPRAILNVVKDNCDNVTDGILRLEWKLTSTSVPVEIQVCGKPVDPVLTNPAV